MERIKKAYYLLFYKLSLFFKEVSDDKWEKPKALIVVNAICILVLIELLAWHTIFFKSNFNFSKFWLAIPVYLLVTFNINFLMSNNNWDNYKKEFKSYSKNKNRVANVLVLIFIIFVFGSLIVAFYQISLIDWSLY